MSVLEHELLQVFELSNIPQLVIQNDGLIIHFNQAFKNICPVRRGATFPIHWSEILKTPQAQSLDQVLQLVSQVSQAHTLSLCVKCDEVFSTPLQAEVLPLPQSKHALLSIYYYQSSPGQYKNFVHNGQAFKNGHSPKSKAIEAHPPKDKLQGPDLLKNLDVLNEGNQLFNLLHNLPGEVALYSLNTQSFIYSNHQLYQILGYEGKVWHPQDTARFWELIHPSDLDSISPNTRPDDFSIRLQNIRWQKASGKYHLFQVWLIPFNLPGQELILYFIKGSQKHDAVHQALHLLNEQLDRQNRALNHHEISYKLAQQQLNSQSKNILNTLEKLRESQTLIKGIALAIPAELNAYDLINNKRVFSNHKLEDILGYTTAELDAMGETPFEELTHPDDLDILIDGRLKLMSEQLTTGEIRLRHKEGHYVWLFISAILLYFEESDINYVVTMAQDITARKKNEQEIHQSNEKLVANQNILEKALKELSNRNFELDQLVYKISHDLRSPLSTILGLVNVIKLENNPNKIQEYVHLIENRILKLDGFVRSMLNYAKTQRTEIQVEEINFDEIIEACISDLEYLESHKRIRTEVSLEGSTTVFCSDLLRLKIIFSNIISNAYKYFNPHASDNFLKIHINIHPNQAWVKFEDNGIGISEEYLNKIYDMFFRATEKSDGSGLGMYIVKSTLEKLEGKIDVQSTLGTGTSFEIVIPNLV